MHLEVTVTATRRYEIDQMCYSGSDAMIALGEKDRFEADPGSVFNHSASEIKVNVKHGSFDAGEIYEVCD
jgi:hypothetical protein